MDAKSSHEPLYPDAEREREALQRLPASIVGTGACAWDIYRFELVYFDPEFQRWQLFQEKEKSISEEGHRRHIQAVLNSLRSAFRAVPHGTRFQIESDKIQAAPVSIRQEQWGKLSRWGGTETQTQELWDLFVDDLVGNADNDGLLDANPAWNARFEKMRQWPTLLARENRVDLELDPAEARDLISLLPILPHWDLYGAIREAWARREDPGINRERIVRIEGQDTKGQGATQPSLWQELGRLRQPFYCTRLVYLQNGRDDDHLRSKQLLGYSVATEAMFVDLTHPDAVPGRIALRDTFQYAYLPTGAERAQYSFYALLLDALQLALMGPAQAPVPNKSGGESESTPEELYYFAYPIFSGLGRRHFLHIYARPDSQSASLDALWTDWRQFHEQLDWEQLRSVLVDELEQVDLARFQAKMNRDMSRYAASPRRADGESIVEPSVAEQSHLLFPVYCACSGSKKWTYGTDGSAVLGRQWRQATPLDEKGLLCNDKKSPLPSCSRLGDRGKSAWRDDQPFLETPVQREINLGRRHRLINQQLEFAGTIWRSSLKAYLDLEAANRALRHVRKGYLAKCKSELLNALNSSSGSLPERFECAQVSAILAQINRGEITAAEFFKPFVSELASPVDRWLRAYQVVAGGSLHAVFSEYVETGVVHWLNHTTSRSSVGKEELLTAYRQMWERVSVLLQLNTSMKSRFDALDGCVTKLLNRLESRREYTHDDLEKEHPVLMQDLDEARRRLRVNCDQAKLRQQLGLAKTDHVAGGPNLKLHCERLIPGTEESTVHRAVSRLRSESSSSSSLFVRSYFQNLEPLDSPFHAPATHTRQYLLLALPLRGDVWEDFWAKQPRVNKLDAFANDLAHTTFLMLDTATDKTDAFSIPAKIDDFSKRAQPDVTMTQADRDIFLSLFSPQAEQATGRCPEGWREAIESHGPYWQVVMLAYDVYKV